MTDKTKPPSKNPNRRPRRFSWPRLPKRRPAAQKKLSKLPDQLPTLKPLAGSKPAVGWLAGWRRSWRRWWNKRQLAWGSNTRGPGASRWQRWRQHRRRQQLLDNLQHPDTFWRRLIWRLHPRRMIAYWFSWRGLWMAFKIGLVAILLLLIAGIVAYRYLSQDLPDNIASLQSCLQGLTTSYYDQTNQHLLWASKSDVDCRPISSLDEASSYLVEAVLAAEDQDFYNHRGIHFSSIARAAINNIRGQPTQGGSTITQQYVKNAILKDRERSVTRKIREVILAVELEQNFTKDEILTAYLNTISFGSIYDGITSASWGYFGKPPTELTLDEASLLVAAIPAPSHYWANQDAHLARQKSVLRLMLNQGRITNTEYQEALEIDILAKVNRSRNQYADIRAPHFVLEAEKRLREIYGQEDIRLAGLRVVTTLDIEAQGLAEAAVAKTIPSLEQRGFDNAAAVAVDVETGKVIAQVGSRDFNYPEFGQINTATTPRDPGSVFKLFSYSTLIENSSDWGAGSTIYDYETTFTHPVGNQSGYTPKNYNNQFNGPVTLRQAFGRSLNIPAIKAMYLADRVDVHEFAQKAGLETPPNCGGFCGLSTAIGGGVEIRLDETTNAYATFGREGEYMPLTYIDQVYDQGGQRLFKWLPQRERVISEQTAYIMNDILSDTDARFSQRFNLKNATAAVKTGTTDDFKNNLIVGYSRKVAFGAWMGHHDITESFGESYTTEPKSIIFKEFMDPYHEGLPAAETSGWREPEGIQRVRVDLQTGYAVAPGSESESEATGSSRVDIYPSWYEPVFEPPPDRVVVIDRVTGKLATDCTPLLARQFGQGGGIKSELSETDPFYHNWIDPIAAALEVVVVQGLGDQFDDLHSCDDLSPEIALTGPDFCQGSCLLTAEIEAGTHDLASVEFFIDDQPVNESYFELSDSLATIKFQFEPTVNSDLIEITAKVLDQALYTASTTIQLATRSADAGLRLEPILVDSSAQVIEISWNPASSGLKLHFSRACVGADPVELGSQATSQIVGTIGLNPGLCQVEIRSPGGEISNSRSFRTYAPEDIGSGD